MMSTFATEVSLHCMICYEEFDLKERPPVVLSCGHTYLCEVCAKRLTKCMECREPLFWTPPAPKVPPMGAANARSPTAPSRYNRGRYQGPPTPPHPAHAPPAVKEEPIPKPLPKNLVLLDMIEAAERQKKLLAEAKKEEEELDMDEIDEDDPLVEPTLAGMTSLAGACGTYAVKEPLGLPVLPFDPNRQHHDHQSIEEKKSESSVREPFTIEDGQTVQVVTEDDGVYKLARGTGFIVATVNQLVKIGGPLEKSCRLEGMLDSVMQKRLKLQRELDEINLLADGFKEQIIDERDRPEDHPVIGARKDTVAERRYNDENEIDPLAKHPKTPEKALPQNLGQTRSLDTGEANESAQLAHTPAQENLSPERLPYVASPPRSCPIPTTRFDHPIDGALHQPFMDTPTAGLPRYRVNQDEEYVAANFFGCGSGLFGENLIEDAPMPSLGTPDMDNSLLALSLDEDETTHSRGLPARLRTAEEFTRGSPARSGSFDRVNFSTGRSVHNGAAHTKKHQSPNPQRSSARLYSDHRGAATVRPISQQGIPHRGPTRKNGS